MLKHVVHDFPQLASFFSSSFIVSLFALPFVLFLPVPLGGGNYEWSCGNTAGSAIPAGKHTWVAVKMAMIGDGNAPGN